MDNRPNPTWHMASWGAVSGFILALFYLTVLIDFFSSATDPNALLLLFNPMAWWLSFLFGAIPGIIMGVIVSTPLWFMLRDVPLPFTKEAMRAKRPSVYSINFLATFGLSLFLIYTFFGSIGLGGFLVVPPFIAAIASTYVAHRYMYRLRLWSGGVESRKTKAKNDALATARLEDPTTTGEDTAYTMEEDAIQTEQRS
ncbi:MAG: hypothetical protein AAF846_28425 [Chloroflexota bacterium]